MSRRVILLLLALVLAPLSGCIVEAEVPAAEVEPASGDDPAAESADGAPPTPTSPTPPPSSTPPAPPAPPGNGSAPDNETAAEPPAPVPTAVAVEIAGTTGAGAGACAEGACHETGLLLPDDRFPQEVHEGVAGYALTLEWAAATPAAETLVFGITVNGGDGPRTEFVSGASPLALSGSNVTAAPGEEFVIWVRMDATVGGLPVEPHASAPQEFAITGMLTVLKLPDA